MLERDIEQIVQQAREMLPLGRPDGAMALAQMALANCDDAARALTVMGQALLRQGQGPLAMSRLELACRMGSHAAEPWAVMGEIKWAGGAQQEAADCLEKAAALNPGSGAAWVNLGIALEHLGHYDRAIEHLRRGLALEPDHQGGHVAMATALFRSGKSKEAIEANELSLKRLPGNPTLWSNLGVLLEKTGDYDRAIEAYDRAVALNPGDAQLRFNRGSSYMMRLDLAKARADWREAGRLDANHAQAFNNLAILELMDGNLAEGFRLFEWRWRVQYKPFPIALPAWDGKAPLKGKRILLYVEQGLGDMIHYSRYIPRLVEMGAEVVLLVLPEIERLMRSMTCIKAFSSIHPPYPKADCWYSVMSLPGVFSQRMEDIPSQTRYLKASPADVAKWKDRLAKLGPGMKVGLAWHGSPNHGDDANRSLALQKLRAWWDVKGIKFVSLQKGPYRDEIAAEGLDILDAGKDLSDLADTAALMENLDLVVCVDTSVAHLAGMLGRPTWIMLPLRPDWRWFLGRTDSPWYPTVKLFRQSRRHDWLGVIERVKEELAAAAAGRQGGAA